MYKSQPPLSCGTTTELLYNIGQYRHGVPSCRISISPKGMEEFFVLGIFTTCRSTSTSFFLGIIYQSHVYTLGHFAPFLLQPKYELSIPRSPPLSKKPLMVRLLPLWGGITHKDKSFVVLFAFFLPWSFIDPRLEEKRCFWGIVALKPLFSLSLSLLGKFT